MISNEQLKEFGFEDISRFPQILIDHVVTISLPSAIAHHLEPVNVVIKKGLAIPVQVSGVPNGMIVRNDGKMVFVGHENPNDFKSSLMTTFTDQIAYDVRLEAYGIMRRAVEVDPLLSDIWLEILSHWVSWYPVLLHEVKRQMVGEFALAQDMIKGLSGFLTNFMDQVHDKEAAPQMIPFKIMVQSLEEAANGWQGEEFCIVESSVGAVRSMSVDLFFKEHVLFKLKQTLRNPVFFARSQFRLYYEPRACPVLKIMVIPPLNLPIGELATGIDL